VLVAPRQPNPRRKNMNPVLANHKTRSEGTRFALDANALLPRRADNSMA
jgi:hypothetical protein